jgi:tetratricopeptide (TPR) repeat protein
MRYLWRCRVSVGMLLTGIFLCLLSSRSEAEDWVGHIFLPKIGHTFYTEDRSRESTQSQPQFPYEVEKVDGDWCKVRAYWIRKQDIVLVREAPSYFSEKLQSGTEHRYSCYQRRGLAWTLLGEHKLAIADNTQALELTSESYQLLTTYETRARNYYALHDTQQSLADLRAASRADPGYDAQSMIAWVLATCPDAKIRNAREAFEIVKTEIMAKPNEVTALAALAATYAEAGDFKQAIEYQKKAINQVQRFREGPRRRRYLSAAEAGLSLYQANRPYRDQEWILDPWFDFEGEKRLIQMIRKE